MRQITSNTYCADAEVLNTLRRDGLGWGHDLDCGCFQTERAVLRTGRGRRLLSRLMKGGA